MRIGLTQAIAKVARHMQAIASAKEFRSRALPVEPVTECFMSFQLHRMQHQPRRPANATSIRSNAS